MVAAAAASEVRGGEEVIGWRARRAREEEEDGNRDGWDKDRNAAAHPARPQSSSTGKVDGRIGTQSIALLCVCGGGRVLREEARERGWNDEASGDRMNPPPQATVIKES